MAMCRSKWMKKWAQDKKVGKFLMIGILKKFVYLSMVKSSGGCFHQPKHLLLRGVVLSEFKLLARYGTQFSVSLSNLAAITFSLSPSLSVSLSLSLSATFDSAGC